jgi:hypothetical protein
MLWLALGGAGWLAACQSADWQLPGFPADADELVYFQEQQQAGLRRAVKRSGRSTSETPTAGRLERIERAQAELIEGLSAGAAGPDQAREVGAELRDSDARQSEAIVQLEERLGSELAQSAAPALGELKADFERALIRLANADREQLERLALFEQRAEQLTERTQAAPASRDWYWLFGLVSLGALPLVAMWLWRGGRSRAQDQIDQLDQRLRDLERPAGDGSLGAVRALDSAPQNNGRRGSEPRAEPGLASAALTAAADADGAAGAIEAEPGMEGLAPFEVPRLEPRLEPRRPGLARKHTATPPLGLVDADFASTAAPVDRGAKDPPAGDGPAAYDEAANLGAAEPDAPHSSAEEPPSPDPAGARGFDPAARRKDFELELVRQLERRPANRASGAVDPFEDFAARRRVARQPAPPNTLRAAAPTASGDLLPNPSQTQTASQGVAPQTPPPQRESKPATEPGATQGQRARGDRAARIGAPRDERSLSSMLRNAPWASLSPLPAAERRQDRFESELGRAFRALEQGSLAMDAEERQTPRARPPLEDEEFLASEDEDLAS